jgi:transposase
MLSVAAVTAARCNPVFKEFYGRLLAARKPRKVALTASMRKLLVVLDAMLRHGTPWGQRALVAA